MPILQSVNVSYRSLFRGDQSENIQRQELNCFPGGGGLPGAAPLLPPNPPKPVVCWAPKVEAPKVEPPLLPASAPKVGADSTLPAPNALPPKAAPPPKAGAAPIAGAAPKADAAPNAGGEPKAGAAPNPGEAPKAEVGLVGVAPP